MNDPLKDVAQDVRSEIARLLAAGKIIEAIKRFREATGSDLRSSKEAIDSMFVKQRKQAVTISLPGYTSSSSTGLPSSGASSSGSDFSYADTNDPDFDFGGTTSQTNDPLDALPSNVRHEISGLIYSGNKIAAIKRYREMTRSSLQTAKQAVEEITEQLKRRNPAMFQDSEQKDVLGLSVIVAVIIIAAGYAATNLADVSFDNWLGKIESLIDSAKQMIGDSSLAKDGKRKLSRIIEPAKVKILEIPRQRDDGVDHETLYIPIAPTDPTANLTTLYRAKMANADYVAWKNLPGLPKGYQDYIEEHRIKYVRAEIARHLDSPTGMNTPIPVITQSAISIDGNIQPQEWQHAARIALEPATTGTTLYLQADNEWLYLAADVPGDTTAAGWDQFRFYIHVDIDPAIRNERIHVDGRPMGILGGIRQTNIPWQGAPPANDDERWKRYPISDWRIYRLAQGASTYAPHRQYEAKMNLAESGLTIGAPFPVFVEIETDPIREANRNTRRYLGNLGSQEQPMWMVMRR